MRTCTLRGFPLDDAYLSTIIACQCRRDFYPPTASHCLRIFYTLLSPLFSLHPSLSLFLQSPNYFGILINHILWYIALPWKMLHVTTLLRTLPFTAYPKSNEIVVKSAISSYLPFQTRRNAQSLCHLRSRPFISAETTTRRVAPATMAALYNLHGSEIEWSIGGVTRE